MKIHPMVRPPSYGIELTEPYEFAWDAPDGKMYRINFVEVFPTHHYLIGQRMIFGHPYGSGSIRIERAYRDVTGLPTAIAARIEDLKGINSCKSLSVYDIAHEALVHAELAGLATGGVAGAVVDALRASGHLADA